MNKPHIDNVEHKLKFSVVNNTVAVDPNQLLIVENVLLDAARFSPEKRTFELTSDKIYHLRFSLNGKPYNSLQTSKIKFYVVECSDPSYNPEGYDPTDYIRFKQRTDDAFLGMIRYYSSGLITIDAVENNRMTDGGVASGILFEPSGDIQSDTVEEAIKEVAREVPFVSEMLIGPINGFNRTYTTSVAFISGTTRVCLNGINLLKNLDFIEIGTNTIQITTTPLSNDTLSVDYFRVS